MLLVVFRQMLIEFQHTAARRRLLHKCYCHEITHSFNTQPHEGGCQIYDSIIVSLEGFNTQPHEGGCLKIKIILVFIL